MTEVRLLRPRLICAMVKGRKEGKPMNRKLKTAVAVLLVLVLLAAVALAGLWYYAQTANSREQAPRLLICGASCEASWSAAEGKALPGWMELPVAAVLDCDQSTLWGLGFDPEVKDKNTAAILLTGSGEEVFRGTLEELAAYTPHHSGDYELIAAPQSLSQSLLTHFYRVQILWQLP